MNKLDLQVKGIHGGVLITLPSVPWYQQRDLLVGRIQTQERFFKGGRIALDVGSTDWSEDQVLKLLKDLSDEGVCLWTIVSSSATTVQSAEYHGFPTSLPDPNKKLGQAQTTQPDSNNSLEKFTCLSRCLGDDECLQHDGNLIVIGDVPRNAKLEVTGSLVLWGTLHGTAELRSPENTSTFMRLLKIENGHLIMDGEEINIPSKLRKHHGLAVLKKDQGVTITSLKTWNLL